MTVHQYFLYLKLVLLSSNIKHMIKRQKRFEMTDNIYSIMTHLLT